ncbi:MAG TPA: LCCL domain-containing protein, partial [Rhodanobacteraceae bacterium]|nr:LCCL domain-containing protein [Rhodanobacteraceae bacterium]
LAMRLPTGVQVDGVAVQVAENDGTKVEPRFKSRSTVKLEFSENFYDITGRLGGKSVVKRTLAKGQTIDGTLITDATPRGDDGWDIEFERIDIPHISGMAESKFEPDSFVVADSDAYKALKDKLAADQKKAADEAAQLAAAQAKAAADRIAAFKKQIVGTWAAKFPMLHNNGVWADNNNHKLGIQIRFDDSTGNIGAGEGILYDFDTPALEAKVAIGYVIDPSGQFATLNFTSNVQAPGVSFHTGPDSQWKFTPDGKLVDSGYNGTWQVQMERDGAVLKARLAAVKKYNDYLNAEHQLAAQYHAANAEGTFGDLHLSDNQYGNFFVVGETNSGYVYGDGFYANVSNVHEAAVHAGVLKPYQAGIVKISRVHFSGRPHNFPATTRNGITSRQNCNCGPQDWYSGYSITLVKALPVYQR